MSSLTVLGLASLGSIGAMAGAAGIAAAPARWRARLLPLLLAFSAGSMLAAAFLGMLPRAYRSLPPMVAGACVLGGLGLMLAIERFSRWHHCHADDCSERRSRGRLILYGDAFHNFVDGIVIAAAFLTSPEVGLAATLAVIAHEVPQEMGDYAVLVDSGLGRWQALGWNLVSALATLPGAL
ncbi:MAG: ZIP family metal transporter, partial [Dechloromonas sp.]|nr:ZIP family metal transporter [Dechloromonas sp.]